MGFCNLVFSLGYLPSPAQIRYFPDGSPVCEFSLVLGEEPDYLVLDVSFPGTTSVSLAHQLKPHTIVFLEGRLTTQKPRPEQGLFHPYRIVASKVIPLGSLPVSDTIPKDKNFR